MTDDTYSRVAEEISRRAGGRTVQRVLQWQPENVDALLLLLDFLQGTETTAHPLDDGGVSIDNPRSSHPVLAQPGDWLAVIDDESGPVVTVQRIAPEVTAPEPTLTARLLDAFLDRHDIGHDSRRVMGPLALYAETRSLPLGGGQGGRDCPAVAATVFSAASDGGTIVDWAAKEAVTEERVIEFDLFDPRPDIDAVATTVVEHNPALRYGEVCAVLAAALNVGVIAALPLDAWPEGTG